MWNRRLSLAAVLACAAFAGPAAATTVYIDTFQVAKNGTDQWFVDTFDDGVPPPSAPTKGYVTNMDPLPGPEAAGKLAMDTAQGNPQVASVSGNVIRIHVARLATDVTDNLTDGLKSDDTIVVSGLFDLVFPDLVKERYSIRLTDFGKVGANDVVEMSVVTVAPGDTRIQYRHADFANSGFDILGSWKLASVPDLGDYEKVLLTLSKLDGSSKAMTGSFVLIDTDGVRADFERTAATTADIFSGEEWTRADFLAVRTVPLPAAAPLMMAASLVLLATARRKKGSGGRSAGAHELRSRASLAAGAYAGVERGPAAQSSGATPHGRDQ